MSITRSFCNSAVRSWIAGLILCTSFSLSPSAVRAQAATTADPSWIEAFHSAVAQLSKTYPYTDLKAIDWTGLETRFTPLIQKAAQDGDAKAYYLAIREFAYSIPDRHLRIRPEHADYMEESLGGYYGFDLESTDDGRLVVSYVDSVARANGIAPGDEVTSWNDRPSNVALSQASVTWARNPPATVESRKYEQRRFLVRAPVGRTVAVGIRRAPGTSIRRFVLTSRADSMASVTRTDWRPSVPDQIQAIDARVLDGGIGYIRISSLTGLTSETSRQIVTKVTTAVTQFKASGVRGLIIDLRHNPGGSDEVAAKVASHFLPERTLYTATSRRDTITNAFVLDRESLLYADGIQEKLIVPTIVMVGIGTKSAAEGLARALQSRRGVTVAGRTSTAGAFGEVGDEAIEFPGGIELTVPYARGVDSQGRMVLEADSMGIGGVRPTFKLPVTRATIVRESECRCDVDLEAVRAKLAKR